MFDVPVTRRRTTRRAREIQGADEGRGSAALMSLEARCLGVVKQTTDLRSAWTMALGSDQGYSCLPCGGRHCDTSRWCWGSSSLDRNGIVPSWLSQRQIYRSRTWTYCNVMQQSNPLLDELYTLQEDAVKPLKCIQMQHVYRTNVRSSPHVSWRTQHQCGSLPSLSKGSQLPSDLAGLVLGLPPH